MILETRKNPIYTSKIKGVKQKINMKHIDFLYQHGMTNKEVAEFTGYCVSTIEKLTRNDEEVRELVKRAKAVADRNVENALYRKAVGFSNETEEFSKDRKTGQITVVKVNKYFPPETLACIFWLKNRKPAEWKDRNNNEFNGNITFNINNQIAPKKLIEEVKEVEVLNA